MKIETLLVNGRILTMDRSRPEVGAVAVAGGRVAALGATAELMARRERDTAIIDLGGRFACPAFIDPHNHFSMTALAPVEVDCRTPPLRAIPRIVERIHEAAAALPPGTWLRGFGYDEGALRERRHPSRAELDEAAPHHPVALVHWSVHRCVLNSAALTALGIDRQTPDPPGGWIVRDPDGLPAGPLYETATNAAQAHSLAAYAERFGALAPALFSANARRYLGAGITTIGDAYVSPALAGLYATAQAAGALPIDVTAYGGSASGLFAPPRHWLSGDGAAARTQGGAEGFRPAGIKLFVDGGNNTTATSLAGAHGHRPARWVFYRQDELDALVAAAHERGMQVAIHAVGDIAVGMALTAMERARAEHPARQPRFRIEHGVLLSDDLIRRMATVGAALVMQPLSVYDHADRLATAPLAEGLRQLPLRDLLDAGVPLAASSDAPCYPMDPLLSVWAAVTRCTRSGGVHAPDQRLSVDEALRLVTAGAARALDSDGDAGTLRPGAAADIAVLSADPRTAPPEAIRSISVLATYRCGRLRYEREQDGAPEPVGRLMDAGGTEPGAS